MRHGLRPLLFLVLCLGASLGSLLLVERFDRRDQARALMVVQVARFGEQTRSRIDKWLEAHRVDPVLSWTTEPPGLFEPTVPVHLSVISKTGTEVYALSVNPETREVLGLNEDSDAFLEDVRAWARTL